jgi:hypothetical protein
MRASHHLVAGLFLLTIAAPAMAQTPECAGYTGNAGRVCSAAVDGTRAFHPLMGLLVSGGNPTLGSAGTMGGLGHAAVTLRANAVQVVFPDLNYNGGSATVPAGDKLLTPAPVVEGSLGLYKGMPSGLLALDFLGSAQLLPTDQIDNLSVDGSATTVGGIALGLGFGARVGILKEMGPLPAVSFSVMRRDIPRISYGDVPAGDRFSYGLDMHATNLRLVASKQLMTLGLAAGLGWDKYTGDALIGFRDPVTNLQQPYVPVKLNTSRMLGFVNAGMDLSVLRLTGELGYQGGKDQKLSSEFQEFDTTKGKFFAGLGLRVGF